MPLVDYALNIAADAIGERTITVHLHTGAPGANGVANRVNGGGYDGVDVPANGWSGAAGGDIHNVGDIAYAQSTSAWGTISHVTLFDGNNYMGFGVFSTPVPIPNRANFTIPARALTINGSSA